MQQIQNLNQVLAGNAPNSQDGPWVPLLANPQGVLYVVLTGSGGSGPEEVRTVSLQLDDQVLNFGLLTGAAGLVYQGAGWDRVRGANVFMSAEVTAAGNTVVWTPQAGNTFRVLGWRASIAGTLATDGTLALQLRDGTTTVFARAGANVAGALLGAGDTQVGEDYGKLGYLSTAADNELNVNLSEAMASGAVYIDIWGLEETP